MASHVCAHWEVSTAAMAAKRVLLLCGDYMEDDYEFQALDGFRPWFRCRRCRHTGCPWMPPAPARRPAVPAAPPSTSPQATRYVLVNAAAGVAGGGGGGGGGGVHGCCCYYKYVLLLLLQVCVAAIVVASNCWVKLE